MHNKVVLFEVLNLNFGGIESEFLVLDTVPPNS